MNSAASDASVDDLATLRRKLAERDAEHQAALAERDERIDSQQRTLVYRQAKIDTLTAEIARLRRWQFGRRSEQLDPGQRALFEDTLAEDIAAVEAQLEALTAPATTPAPPRRPSRREPLPAHLARIEHRHEPASCTCEVCGGALVKIGEDVSERLDCEPVRFFVQRDIYPKYACRPCQRIVAEPVAPAIIERGRPSAALLAHIAVSKWVDHLPLYRQSAIYTRSGVTLSRGTLAEWAGRIGVALTPLAEAMQAQLLQQSVLHADETPVAMLNPGAGKTKQAYLFAYRSADPQAPAITVFDFCTSRSGEHARRFLGDWQGALMVDDFAGYKAGFARRHHRTGLSGAHPAQVLRTARTSGQHADRAAAGIDRPALSHRGRRPGAGPARPSGPAANPGQAHPRCLVGVDPDRTTHRRRWQWHRQGARLHDQALAGTAALCR